MSIVKKSSNNQSFSNFDYLWVIQCGVEGVKEFIMDNDINAPSDGKNHDMTLLMCAVSTSNLACVKFLLENGADPNIVITSKSKNLEDRDAFSYLKTFSDNHQEIILALIDHGGDPHQTTPNLISFYYRQEPHLKELIDRKLMEVSHVKSIKKDSCEHFKNDDNKTSTRASRLI